MYKSKAKRTKMLTGAGKGGMMIKARSSGGEKE